MDGALMDIISFVLTNNLKQCQTIMSLRLNPFLYSGNFTTQTPV